MMTRTTRIATARELTRALSFASLGILLAAAVPAHAEHGYSYLRTVEGYGSVQTVGDDQTYDAIENQPLIPGDILLVGSNSRVEAVLSDGALIRVGDRTELRFDALALTPDTGDTSTRLYLAEGEVQIALGGLLEADGPVEIGTGNASIYLEAPGEYTVRSNGYDATEVVVREGFAEAQTDRGSAILRAGEAGYVDGTEWASVEVARAQGPSELEDWGAQLDAEARLADLPYVDPDLRYRAARMSSHGTWIEIGDRWGWRPYVDASWRPYVHGDWRYTPSGLTWVSNEPWGWVPSHYGSWDLVPGYGWTWFVGSYYTPAAVYWYWGPTHVAWVPAGFYTSFYAPRRYVAPRWGVYGYAGGDWDFFAEWTFCPTRYFGRPHYNQYFRPGHEVARHASYRQIPRGVIATDTRSLGREVWGQPERIAERLTLAHSRTNKGTMPDVTDFVARKRDVDSKIAEIVRPQDAASVRLGRPVRTEVGTRSPRTAKDLGRLSVDRRQDAATRDGDSRLRTWERSESGAEDERGRFKREAYDRGEIDRFRVRGADDSSSRRFETSAPRLKLRSDSAVEGVDRLHSASSDEGSVARRVIEKMRLRQSSPTGKSVAPAPPSGSRGETASGRTTSTSKRGAPSRSSGERVRSGSSSSSKSRTSSKPPPRRSTARSRSSSRKPPAGGL